VKKPISVIAPVLGAVLLLFAVVAGRESAPEHVRTVTVTVEQQAPGMFETTGGGAITLGCSLWDVPDVSDSYDGDPHDFILQAARDSILGMFVHDGRLYMISGEQCGFSIDWRRFPETPRPQDAPTPSPNRS